jgi:Tfp pilus assembly protein PilO
MAAAMLVPLTSTEFRPLNAGLNLLGVVVTFAIVATGYARVMRPVNEQQREVTAQIEAIQTLSARATAIHERRREVQRWLAQRESMPLANVARVPESLDEQVFLSQVAELSQASGTETVRSTCSDPIDEGTHAAMDMRIDLAGDYPAVCRFLEGLQSSPRLCGVQHMHIQRAAPDTERLTIELTLRIYAAPVAVAQAGSTSHE